MFGLPARHFNKRRAEMVPTSPLVLNRKEQEDKAEFEKYDIVIVGGGVTGAYCAYDAVLRGYRVALIEKSDFASGTSSKSSKMVHGGLRYIEQGNIGLVRHSLHERQRLRRNAPHLVQRLPFLFPVMEREGIFDARLAKAFEGLLWTFNETYLKSGLMYFDARVDDARLTLTLARSAAYFGATILNHTKVTQMVRRENKVVGVVAVTSDGREIPVESKSVIMATGVWLRDWSGAANESEKKIHIRPAKGVHVAIPWIKIRNDCTVTIPVPGRSRRATITRWGNVSYLGTTDEDYDGDLDNIYCTRRELDFLLEGANSALTTDLTCDDVVGSIAGCRPLVASSNGTTMDAKRDHEIHVAADGLVTIVGGKLTTSRFMAEQTIDAVQKVLGSNRKCRTKKAYLLGGAGYDAQSVVAGGGIEAHLAERYGNEAQFVSAIMQDHPDYMKPIVEGLAYTEAEVVYAVRHEMALTVDDVLSRRMRARIMARDASARAAGRVGQIIQKELGLTSDVIAAQVSSYIAETQKEKLYLLGEKND